MRRELKALLERLMRGPRSRRNLTKRDIER
jgi:hypothetical protein